MTVRQSVKQKVSQSSVSYSFYRVSRMENITNNYRKHNFGRDSMQDSQRGLSCGLWWKMATKFNMTFGLRLTAVFFWCVNFVVLILKLRLPNPEMENILKSNVSSPWLSAKGASILNNCWRREREHLSFLCVSRPLFRCNDGVCRHSSARMLSLSHPRH